MRVTAYLNGALVGTATTNAQAGTWPSETLRFSSAQTFNQVVVHYDAPTGDRRGLRPHLHGGQHGGDACAAADCSGTGDEAGQWRFPIRLHQHPGSTFTVWCSTNVALPAGQLEWAWQRHGKSTRFRFLSIHRPAGDEPVRSVSTGSAHRKLHPQITRMTRIFPARTKHKRRNFFNHGWIWRGVAAAKGARIALSARS